MFIKANIPFELYCILHTLLFEEEFHDVNSHWLPENGNLV